MSRIIVILLSLIFACTTGADEIHWAARKNQVGTISRLLKRNPNLVHERDLRSKRTALHVAAEHGSLEAARLLIDAEANIDAVTKDEGTPLDVAAAHAQQAIAELLIERGAKATPHTYAALGMTEQVLKSDDLNMQDDAGRTLLFHAVRNKHAATAKALLMRAVDPNILTAELESPIEAAVLNGDAALTILLIAGGASPHQTNAVGQTMLHLSPNADTATIFLAYEIDPNQPDAEGSTALHHAVGQRNVELVNRLIEFGAKVNATDKDGRTALHLAARFDHPALAALLIDKEAAVDAMTNEGNTPLHACSLSKASPKQVPALLLKAGAPINALNKAKQTPLDLEQAAIKQWEGLDLDDGFLRKVNATAELYIKHGGKTGVQIDP